MNRAYKLKFSHSSGRWVAVSEISSAHGKKSGGLIASVAITLALLTPTVSFAGDPGVGNVRPSVGVSRVNDLEIDAALAVFRQDPTAIKYHVNSGDAGVNYYNFGNYNAA